MSILKTGDWIMCSNRDEPGKVISINFEKNICVVAFFTEWSSQEDAGGTAEESVSSLEIREIIKDPEMISDFEKEIKGEVDFEKD